MQEKKELKFHQCHQVILKTKLGWHVRYEKQLVERITPGYIVLENQTRYNRIDGRQIGTSTPDYVYLLTDVDNETNLTFNELYELQFKRFEIS